eukprot:SAG11_NODE_1594_length_4612_cov_11.187458_3_plen_58_part_00
MSNYILICNNYVVVARGRARIIRSKTFLYHWNVLTFSTVLEGESPHAFARKLAHSDG